MENKISLIGCVFECLGAAIASEDLDLIESHYQSYLDGCQATKSSPVTRQEFTTVLANAMMLVQQVAHTSLTKIMEHDFSEEIVSEAKRIINAADEGIPGELENVRDMLRKSQPQMEGNVSFEDYWEMRHSTEVFQMLLFSVCEGVAERMKE